MGRGLWRGFVWAMAATGLLALAGCDQPSSRIQGTLPHGTVSTTPAAVSADQKARNFVSVVQRMEPAVEQQCLSRRNNPIRCDFQFVVDDREGMEPNAFQTVDNAGRPVIGFTLSLIMEAQNADEIAFVLGHEASHHILGHLDVKAGAAKRGAVILGAIAAANGGDPVVVRGAQSMGAEFGSRFLSKELELQADYLGAIISKQAGYDPVRGSDFFDRLADPGDMVLGSHPSRAARKAQVRRAVADLQAGRAQ